MKKIIFVSFISLICLCICPLYAGAAAISFEDAAGNTSITDLEELMSEWSYSPGTGDTVAAVQDDGNNDPCLYMKGFVHMNSTVQLDTPYTFTTEFRTEALLGGGLGIFVRGGINADAVFPYYEWDFYAEDGGKNGASSIGGSGMTLIFAGDGMYLNIKNRQDDGRHVSVSTCKFDYPDGFVCTKYNKLSYEDDGQKVTVNVNDTLLATVEMSNIGTYNDTDDVLAHTFYRTAVVRNASGAEVLSMDNARLVAENYCAAIGVRSNTVYFKSIALLKQASPSTEPPATDTTGKTTSKPTSQNPVKTGDATTPVAVIYCIAISLIAGSSVLRKCRQ